MAALHLVRSLIALQIASMVPGTEANKEKKAAQAGATGSTY